MTFGIETTVLADGSVTVVDARTVSACKVRQLALVRQACAEWILAAAPDYRQRNAALGVLDENEAEAVRTVVMAGREHCAELEAAIDAVAWNGQESTRKAACDAVQAIHWGTP